MSSERFRERKSVRLPRWAWGVIALLALAGLGAIVFGITGCP